MLYNGKKEKEKFIAPIDDDRAIVHCSMANGVHTGPSSTKQLFQ